jgi:Mrp family chromosome partitioning ATPase
MTARARNALRRPVFIGAVSTVTFAASLIALVVVPQQARRAATAIRPTAAARPDTAPTMAALAEAERQVARADSAITASKAELAQLVAATAAAAAADTTANGDPVSAGLRARRDSLTGEVALLGRLLARSENAPLLGSYRALAEASPMQADPRVRQLLDSLVAIERERESYNAVGGVDPVFVALTARANELGRSIEGLAGARRDSLRREVATLAPPAPALPAALASRPLPDTMARIAARDTARTVAGEVANRLARERAELQRLDAREERARELANVGASPPAMLAAALIFGAMIGFGIALFDEVRRPRVADSYEAERATGVRVLGVIRPLPPSPERGRRASDRSGPPYIDPGADGHQLIYLTIAAAGANALMLTVTGDSPAVSAVVAINFAAIAAEEARGTLLVDTDGAASTVASALRLPSSAGVSGLIDGKVSWPEAIRISRIGRDRTIDVVPSGEGMPAIGDLTALLQRDIARLSRRYDALVLVSSADQVSLGLPAALPIPDVVYCARVGQTPIADLKTAIDEIGQAGGRVRGIVLWNAPDPALVEVRPAEQAVRETANAV